MIARSTLAGASFTSAALPSTGRICGNFSRFAIAASMRIISGCTSTASTLPVGPTILAILREMYPVPAPMSATVIPGDSFSSGSSRSVRSSCSRSSRSSHSAPCHPMIFAIWRPMYRVPIPSGDSAIRS